MKKKNTPRAKQGQYGKLTAKEKARIDKDFDGMAALFSDDDAARNAAKKRREAEYTPPPIQTELDILLERLNQLPIDEHDHDLAGKVMRFFDEVGGGKPTIDLVYRALLFGAMLGGNPITAPTMDEAIAAFEERLKNVEATVGTIKANTKPHKQRKNAESGFDAAMKKRDHKRRKPPGAEPAYEKEKIQEAVAEIKRRVKDSKGKLTTTQAAKDVRESMMLFKMDAEYLRRECYERKGAKHTAGDKIVHR